MHGEEAGEVAGRLQVELASSCMRMTLTQQQMHAR